MNPANSASPVRDAAMALSVVQIDGFHAGVMSGTVEIDRPEQVEDLFIIADRRMIGSAPVAWPSAQKTGNASRGVFRFDARYLPPDLLLGSTVRFEVRAGVGATEALAVLDIETADLFPRRCLTRGRGKLEGYIDATDGGTIRGWVWDPTAAHRRVKLHLFVDDLFCGIYEASRPRPDVQVTGRGDGAYGFAIPANAFLAKARSPSPSIRIVSLEPEHWEVPNAPHMAAGGKRRFAFSWPRPSSIPSTPRDLAALLTGAEPFPKKVYLLDRATQRMPDAFSADYLLLGLEFMRIEMIDSTQPEPGTWGGRLRAWRRQRLIKARISRLAALAEAAAATQNLLRPSSKGLHATGLPAEHHEKS